MLYPDRFLPYDRLIREQIFADEVEARDNETGEEYIAESVAFRPEVKLTRGADRCVISAIDFNRRFTIVGTREGTRHYRI